MPAPSTQRLLEAIAAELRGDLPALHSCAVHDGKWDAAEVKRWAVAAPALLVASLGVVSTETPGERWTDCGLQLAIYVMTRDGVAAERKLPRGEAARNLVDWLLLHVPRTRWGLTGIGPVEELRAENLYSGAVDQTGIALWAVTWRQTLRLEAAADGTCPPLPAELYASAQDDPDERLHPEAA